MNWDFFIGYWIGCAISAVIFAALRISDRKDRGDDDDDYHYEPIDDDLVNGLAERGYSVRATDITGGVDFLTIPPAPFDCIVTNPPYSLKQQFLERCYELGKPFALLLPLTTFETEKRQALFRKHGVEVVFLPKRLNFETPSGKGAGSWFATMWITHGLNIHQTLTFSQ